MIRLLSNPKSSRRCPSKRRITESLYCKRSRTLTLTYWRKNRVESATQSREVSRLHPKYSRKRRKLYMHRDLKYRSKLLYLVRTSWAECVDPQAECMQVVWGPWKLRTRRGMGITGMRVHRSPTNSGTPGLPWILPLRELHLELNFPWTQPEAWMDAEMLSKLTPTPVSSNRIVRLDHRSSCLKICSC